MKFGLLMELSVPRPWVNNIEYKVFHDALEQVTVAEGLGFDHVWCVEHHFLEEYSHCSCPEIFLAVAAAKTSKIRLGFGIATCVPQISHPAKLAEKTAFLDVMSGGRVEVGTGRSSTWNELGGFGASIDDTKKSWDEFVRAIPKMWMQERFAHKGLTFSMPERAVLPKPYQKPHPPMWVAVTAPGTELDAADRGMGCLTLSFGNIGNNGKRFDEYRKRIKTCDPVGAFVNEQIIAANWLYCHEDKDYALKRGRELVGGFGSAAAQISEIKGVYPASNYLEAGLLGMFRADPDSASGKGKMPDGLCLGDPKEIITVLKRWEETGIDRLVFLVNYMEVLTQKEVLDSLRLFAREVMPHFDQDCLSIELQGGKIRNEVVA